MRKRTVRSLAACLVSVAMAVMLVPAAPAVAATGYSFSYEMNEDGTLTVTGISNKSAKKVTVPRTIDGIEVAGLDYQAFLGSEVEELRLPKTLRCVTWDYDSFKDNARFSGISGAYALSSVVVEEGSSYLSAVDGALYSADMSTLICYPTKKRGSSFSVPEGVRDFSANSFQGEAFYLKAITLPASFSTMENNWLSNCRALETIALAQGNSSFAVVDGVLFSKDLSTLVSYPSNKAGKHYAVPSMTRTLGNAAINTQLNLESVSIPEGLSEIDCSLVCCPNLRTIEVDPANRSFAVVDGLLVSRDGRTLYACPAGMKRDVLYVPDSVETILACAFDQCRITTLVLPESANLGDPYSCTFYSNNLKTLYVSTREQYKDVTLPRFGTLLRYDPATRKGTKVAYVWEMAGEVDGGQGAEPAVGEQFAVELPAGRALFTLTVSYGAKSAMSLSARGGGPFAGEVRVDYYPVGAGGVVSLNTLRYNSRLYKITAVNKGVLKKSRSAVAVTLGDNVASVAAGAFQGCPNLAELRLGKGLKSIGKSAFYKCPKLSLVVVRSTALQAGKVGASAFKGTAKKALIKAPASKLKAYKKIFLKAGASKKISFKKI